MIARGAFLSMSLLGALGAAILPAQETIRPDPAAIEFFESKVRPVLAEHCYRCHSSTAKRLKGGLLLDSRAGILRGGDSGPVIVAGKPEKSRLIQAIRYTNVDLMMPPNAKLPNAVIVDLTKWVKMGAAWPDDKSVSKAPKNKYDLDLPKRKKEHWAWQPIQHVEIPEVKDKTWPRNCIDHFILAKLESKGMKPAPSAERRTFIRRVTFDLVGLPPTPEDVQVFVNDTSKEAFEKVVDRLLSSPHFGERWGRHWLDLVRYAETRGHEFDYPAPNAYQYRDYVIRALNADVPYNQFVLEHLAGDLLARPRVHPKEGYNESILGTGFWFLGEQVHSPVDVCQDKADRYDNMLDVFGKTFLGLTIACARCHDHKFDAVSTKDYYALCGFLESSGYRLTPFDTLEHNRKIAQEIWQVRHKARPVLQQTLAEAAKPGLEKLADTLLATRAALVLPPDRLKDIAAKHKLDSDRLRRWVAYLRTLKDTNDPFYPWARIAADPESAKPERRAAVLKSLADQFQQRSAETERALKDGVVIVDYSAKETSWLPDGFAFGPGPAQPWDLRLGPNPGFQEKFAAVYDSTWSRLRLAPATENDPGALGGIIRAGRTLRTPTFTIKPGTVYYLMRGSAQVYAAVEGHNMIAGPLHAQLVRTFKTGPAFQWLEHDLTSYQGRRTHIEFTPTPGADFALVMVVQSAKKPANIDPPNQAIAKILDARSLDDLALGYQKMFLNVVSRSRLPGGTWQTDDARLANWLLQHADLLESSARTASARQAGPTSIKEEIAAALRPYLAEEARLSAQLKTVTHLAPAMWDGSGVNENVFIRGSYKTPGEAVPRRFLEALAGPKQLAIARGSGRLELAKQILDPKRNPFLARVHVNRIWHHLFGRGIVASVDNFGVLGESPSHPDLLDHLAERFVQEGWSQKKLIRALVLSQTYRMSSRPSPQASKIDPQNILLSRMNIRRLEGEAIRDAMLSVSGRLDAKLFGPSVPVYLNEFQEGRGRPASGPLDGQGRRSIYLAVRRNFLPAMLLAFDTPIPFSTVGRRTVSNVPAQALILLNDPFVHQQAGVWAKKVMAGKETSAERIQLMYLAAFSRPPDEHELNTCLRFLEEQRSAGPEAGWASLAHVLFNTKELIFLE
jgi:hypothetical protein